MSPDQRRPSLARPQHHVRVVRESDSERRREQAVCDTCDWRGPVRVGNHAEHDAEDHAPGTLCEMYGMYGLSTRHRWGHAVEITVHPDGTETAYCPPCERTISRAHEDNRLVTLRAHAHARVTTGAPANEFIAAQSALWDGRMSTELYDIVVEERRLRRHSLRRHEGQDGQTPT